MLVSTHGIIAQTSSGTPPFSNTKSILLDGVDDFVNMGNPSSLQITGDLSISAWFKTSSTSAQVIVSKDYENPTRSFLLIYSSSSNTIKFIIFQGSSINVAASTSLVADGNWHHVMGVNDGADLKIYIDGTLEGTNVGGGGSINNTSAEFRIGNKQRSPGDFFNGAIDEVAIFNTGLSASAVSTIYNSGVPNDISSISGLVSWWRFEGTGTTATDSGSGGNNGTLTNGVTRSADVP